MRFRIITFMLSVCSTWAEAQSLSEGAEGRSGLGSAPGVRATAGCSGSWQNRKRISRWIVSSKTPFLCAYHPQCSQTHVHMLRSRVAWRLHSADCHLVSESRSLCFLLWTCFHSYTSSGPSQTHKPSHAEAGRHRGRRIGPGVRRETWVLVLTLPVTA